MNLDALWNYMQLDLEADKFGNDMRRSAKRQLLLKHRDFLKEQQNNIAKIEADVASMNTRIEEIEAETERLTKLLAEMKAQMESNPPTDGEDIKTRSAAMQKVLDGLGRYERELTKIRKDAENRDRQQKDILNRAAKTKAEYDAVKVEYDKEFADDSRKLKELRARADAEEKKMEAADLAKYKTIKQHVTPPMALMVNDQCSGCYMSLPLGTRAQVKNMASMVTCDNCGRILWVKD